MYLGGCDHHFMPATAIFQKFYFLKKDSKIQELFCVNLSSHFRSLLRKTDLYAPRVTVSLMQKGTCYQLEPSSLRVSTLFFVF